MLAQVEQRPQPVDERHHDVEAGRQCLAVAAEPLDDACARLRDDPNRATHDEQHEHRDDQQRDEFGTHDLLRSVDQSSRTLDLHDVDRRPCFEHLVLEYARAVQTSPPISPDP